MAAPVGRFFRVGDLLQAFQRAGCTIRTAEATTPASEGDVYNLRYLISVDGSAYMQLVDLDDNDRVPESEVRLWERRLSLRIPRP